GGSRGIGRAIVQAFAEAGADVVIASRKADACDSAAAEVTASTGRRAVGVGCHVGRWEECDRLIASTLDQFGRLDILVNNAGTTQKIPHTDLDAATVEVWRRIFEVNVFGAWLLSQRAMPLLRAGGRGSIVNVSSLAGSTPTGSSIPYAASKAALNHQTRLLAKVAGPEVTVNAVAPGLITTPWTSDWTAEHDGVRAVAPLKRVGTPDDVAHVVLAVATAAYMTGQVVAVDGGLELVL
ncbi:MAG: SDR family NAD(P)-dependent oxidoreductase, partial [Acidimicrobiales bacterium]